MSKIDDTNNPEKNQLNQSQEQRKLLIKALKQQREQIYIPQAQKPKPRLTAAQILKLQEKLEQLEELKARLQEKIEQR